MKITKFNNDNKTEIVMGIVLPKILYELYLTAIDLEIYESILKSNLGIDKNRLVKFVEAIQHGDKPILILVIYNKFSKRNIMKRESLKTEVKDFNFRIFNYDFNRNINIEHELEMEGNL